MAGVMRRVMAVAMIAGLLLGFVGAAPAGATPVVTEYHDLGWFSWLKVQGPVANHAEANAICAEADAAFRPATAHHHFTYAVVVFLQNWTDGKTQIICQEPSWYNGGL